MKRQTYFQVHKNKKPKISKPVLIEEQTHVRMIVAMRQIVKHQGKTLTPDEVMQGRSSKYKFLDF